MSVWVRVHRGRGGCEVNKGLPSKSLSMMESMSMSVVSAICNTTELRRGEDG